jgi:selenocysteine-specific elongation factor
VHVLATAGHVDHGKSTLVRLLTGMEPDRWAEERRRGMTIDLGYAWTSLPSAAVVAFVDVPGHHRFLANMLAGVGPVPVVMFVVAADGGWQPQSEEHLAAIEALGVRHGVLVVTRSDLADPTTTTAQAQQRLAATSLAGIEAVATSARTGHGIPQLRAALDRVVAGLPAPEVTAPVRLWIDRSFTIRGAGTVVTGTLAAGTLRVGDELILRDRAVRVRALQALGVNETEVAAVARVAVNLRDVATTEVRRGDVLMTPGSWHLTTVVDVRLSAAGIKEHVVLHVGSAAVPVHVRPLSETIARLQLSQPLPLRVGDRCLLRDPALQSVAAGAVVLDADPPELAQRGAAANRAAALEVASGAPDPAAEVQRRGAITAADLVRLGMSDGPSAGVLRLGDWRVSEQQWEHWLAALSVAVDFRAGADPLDPGLPEEAARRAIGLPDPALLAPLVAAAGLRRIGGRISPAAVVISLGAAEAAVSAVEERLRAVPFAAPDASELAALGLGSKELAAAATVGRLLRLANDVVLLPDAPAVATSILRELVQPFTTGQARTALGTTRRVVIPLLEHLDRVGQTRRCDDVNRRVIA